MPDFATTDLHLAIAHHLLIFALAGATAYLKLLGDLTGGWMLAKGALAASKQTDDDADQWWQTRIGLARVFAEQVLAQTPGLAAGVTAGAIDLVKTSARALGAAN